MLKQKSEYYTSHKDLKKLQLLFFFKESSTVLLKDSKILLFVI